MSWLSGIAGKAEALLDRMDQAAATSIQSTGIATPKSQSRVDEQRPVHQTSLTYEPTASAPTDKPLSVSSKPSSSSLSLHGAGTPPKSYSPVSRPETTPQTTPTPSSYNAYSKSRRSVPSDESLFQFLNTPTRQAAKKTHTPKKLSRASFQSSSTQPAVDSHLKEGGDTPGLPVSGVEEGVEEGGGQGGGREGARSSLSEGAVDREEEGVGREDEGLSGDLRPREDTDDGGRGPPHDVPTQFSAATGNSELAAGHVTPDMPLQEGVESRDTVEPGGQAAESGRQSAGMGERDTAHAVVVQRQPRPEGTGEKQGSTGTSQPPEHQVVGTYSSSHRSTVLITTISYI